MNKRITVVVLAVLMFVLALPVNAAISVSSIEVRGAVWNETGPMNTTNASWNPQNFAGFYYDLKDDLGKENLTIYQNDLSRNQRTIAKSNLVYMTQAQPKRLKAAEQLN